MWYNTSTSRLDAQLCSHFYFIYLFIYLFRGMVLVGLCVAFTYHSRETRRYDNDMVIIIIVIQK